MARILKHWPSFHSVSHCWYHSPSPQTMNDAVRTLSRNRQVKYGFPSRVAPLLRSASKAKKSACWPGSSSPRRKIGGLLRGMGVTKLWTALGFGVEDSPNKRSRQTKTFCRVCMEISNREARYLRGQSEMPNSQLK